MVYEVVHCAECGKPIKSVPTWLAGVSVKFTCESCRQKHPRPFLGAESTTPIVGAAAPKEEMDGEAMEIAGEDGQAEDMSDDLVEEEAMEQESLAE